MKNANDQELTEEQMWAALMVLLTVKQVGELTNQHERTVWRMHDSGKMPRAIRPGGKSVRWRKSDILKWIELGCDMAKFNAAKGVTS